MLLVAAVLRFWRLGVDLPHYPSPDEPTQIGLAVRILAGDPNPHTFLYGTLWPYVLAAGFAMLYGLGRLLGWYGSTADFELAYFTDPSAFYLVGRALSAGLGVATAAVVYAIARRVTSPAGALLAAATLAVAPLHVDSSRALVSDAPVTFAVALTFLLTVRYVEGPSPARIWIPAITVGLATSVKYTAAAMLVPLLAAVHLRASAAPAVARLRWAASAVAAVALGFFAGTPFALPGLPTALAQLRGLWSWHMVQGHHATPETGALAAYLFDVLPRGVGPAATVLGAAGLLLLLVDRDRRRRVVGLLLLWLIVPFTVVIGVSKIPFGRYIVPLVPFVCIAAAVAGMRAVTALSREGRGYLMGTAAAGVALLVAPGVASVGAMMALGKPDTREVAAAWITSHVTPGTAIATELYGPSVPAPLAQLRFRIGRLETIGEAPPEITRQLARLRRRYDAMARDADSRPSWVSYTIVVSSMVPDAAEVPYSVPGLRALGVRYVVLSSPMWIRFEHFPDWYREPAGFHRELRRAGTVLALAAVDDRCAERRAALAALGFGGSWCRRYRGPSLRIVELP